MMKVIGTKEVYALWRPGYGFADYDGWYCKGYPGITFATKEEAERCSDGQLLVYCVQITSYDCDHSTQFAYKIGHGKNAGKWIAVCAHCGAKSRGRPKSTEAIAHASLTQHPSVGAIKAFIVGYEA